MSDDILQRRIDFLVHLLAELKNSHEQSLNKKEEMEASSEGLYEGFFNEYKESIGKEVHKYEENIKKTAQLNYEIIESINRWYDFVKDHDEIKRLLFPVRFYFKQRALKRKIKQLNQQISGIALENRFIKGKVVNWESELENKVLEQIKQGNNYETYLHLLERKENLIADFEYLLSTLPVEYPIRLDLNDIDGFVEKFKNIAAA